MFLSGVEFLFLLLIEVSVLISHGGNRMEWIWRTATELNMPNSPKLPNSVQEVFCEISEPNPMGNPVMSEETHGNAVAGAATASPVTQPPVDTVSLASSCTNKHHCTHQACFFRTVTLF